MYILFTVGMCIVQLQVEDYDTILEMEIDTSENRTLQILAFYQVLKDLLQVLIEQCLIQSLLNLAVDWFLEVSVLLPCCSHSDAIREYQLECLLS